MKVLLLLILLCACQTDPVGFGPDIIVSDAVGLEPYRPLDVYTEWYRETEECLDEMGNFNAINWWRAEELRDREGNDAAGITEQPHTIIIQRGYERTKLIIRHEMAHHITKGREIHFANGTRAVCDGGPS